MNNKLYNITVEVTTKTGEQRLSYASSEFTEGDTIELMKLLLAEHAPDPED
ncbi:MAG: hypothetical protein HFJ27_01725 [Clostridia bacterium]|nr:hypothetical protein [Clostridia bacterium]